MKIGLNTYSFRNEIENKKLTLDKVWQIAQKIGVFEGIELLDRHIPSTEDGNLSTGIKQVIEETAGYGLMVYALSPHVHLYFNDEASREKEAIEFKKWTDLAADNGIHQFRCQVRGPFNLLIRMQLQKSVNVVKAFLDKVLPYAEERGVKVGIETHEQLSSYPPFLKAISDSYENNPAVGIIFDWGHFPSNKNRYAALSIAAIPHNQIYNHVKIFHFDEHFQETRYDSMKIVSEFAKNDFKGFFSVEFEGKQPSLEGVYKSAIGLKYAITNGQYEIDKNFDWNTLAD
jgi:sugar phosphate isomerase/epimerase